jgi:N-acetylmuramate 1-kinase
MNALRETRLLAFLAASGWQKAHRAALAGDASNRRYERLTGGPGGEQAVLMDAPPEKGEDIRPFIAIARHLKSLGLSPPEVIHADEPQGFALLEDLGDTLFAHLLAQSPEREAELYLAATHVLLRLHAAPPPPAPDYGPKTMAPLAGLAFDWYGLGATGHRNDTGKVAMLAELASSLDGLQPWRPVLVLRDYHAENLFWLADRKGAARVGLIDFQDAGIGHPAYDLVSLARDARRNVRPDTETRMIAHYCAATGQSPDSFGLAAAVMSAQRSLRILGVFARLSLHFGKPHYVDLIPRTWAILMNDLDNPALERLRRIVCDNLPEPTPEILEALKAKCGTIPKL